MVAWRRSWLFWTPVSSRTCLVAQTHARARTRSPTYCLSDIFGPPLLIPCSHRQTRAGPWTRRKLHPGGGCQERCCLYEYWGRSGMLTIRAGTFLQWKYLSLLGLGANAVPSPSPSVRTEKSGSRPSRQRAHARADAGLGRSQGAHTLLASSDQKAAALLCALLRLWFLPSHSICHPA